MSDGDELLLLLGGIIGAFAAAKLVDYLAERKNTPLNRYQAGVATQTAASVVAQALETLTDKGYVTASGDRGNPNERTYRLRPGVMTPA